MRLPSRRTSTLPKQMIIRMVEIPLVGVKVIDVQPEALDWARDTIKYLDNREQPEDQQEARKVRRRVARYTLIE